ncbi:hypothetical protein ACF0H5_017641 [Mactra antiquata]
MFHGDLGLSFNEAREVCQEMGGDLAKIDSKSLMDEIVEGVVKDFNYDNFFLDDYYVGIIRTEANKFYWVADCSEVTYLSHYDIESFDNELQCFRHQKDSHASEPVNCETQQAFLCQIYTNPTPTPTTSVITNQVSSSSQVACPTNYVTITPTPVHMNVTDSTTITESVTMTPNMDLFTTTIIETFTQTIEATTSETVTGFNEPSQPSNCINVTAENPVTNTMTVTQLITVVSTSSQNTITLVQCFPSTTASVTMTYSPMTDEELESRVHELVKGLTVDAKSTSNYQRKLISVEDSRESSKFISFTCAAIIVVPFAVLIISDIKSIIFDLFRLPAKGKLVFKA